MKWIWRISGTLVVFVAIAVIGLFVVGRMTLPQVDGEVALPALENDVRIVRDRFAVPHIYAGSREDTVFALGFVHAQDRLWQLELQRRIGQGRLSEFAGEQTLQTDIFLRTLGFYRAAEATVPNLDARTRRLLQRYADGVNAFLENDDGLLPPEFLILGIEPEPWKPADSLVWLKMMALDLSGNWTSEATRAQVAELLGPERMRQIWPPYPADGPVALPDRAALDALPGIGPMIAAAQPFRRHDGLGSNNWVVDGSRSATGKPLLANDPHLGLQTPSVWYFAHWDDGETAAMGATLPGLPFVVLGRNRHLAWGFTNTGPDTQDLVIEQINPDNPAQYRTEAGWADFETREEVIRVKDSADRTITVRETRNGPVLNEATGRVREFAPEDHVVALRWHVLEANEMTARAGLRAADARTVTELQEIMRDFDGAQQNIVIADVEGNIGFVAAGKVPIRADRSPWQGMLPVRGWEAEGQRLGYVPHRHLPSTVNPESGFVVTANNRIVGDDYPYFLTNEWAPPYRAQRITDLLTARNAHSVESFKTIQADQVSLMAREFLPLMLAFQPAGERARAVVADLKIWNGDMSADRIEPTVFSAWYRQFVRQVLIDEGRGAFEELWAPRVLFMRRVLTDADGMSIWCDDVATDGRETCADMLSRSLDLALADLEQRFGADRQNWVWGPIHEALSDHNPFTHVPVLRDIFDIRTPVGGDSFTVNVAHSTMRRERDPFTTNSAASMRAIYDLDDLDRSLYIHSTGQSGNVLSGHYSGFVDRWRRVDYIPMSMRPEDIEPGAIGVLRLVPGR
ncbi:MAG: hypothetical protein TEF_09795 [Rhizobiales bacterium NRL2]|jgi:penicillin amidase|nr:MAG: hypothetical protein TEF_09795 [Rhizobiales bacterium NRL2]